MSMVATTKLTTTRRWSSFVGECLGLSGGVDFYGSSPVVIRLEFIKSLDVILEVCKEQGFERAGII